MTTKDTGNGKQPARLPAEDRDWLTTREVCELYPIGRRTLDRHAAEGTIPFGRTGPGPRARRIYKRDDLEAFLYGNGVPA